MDERRCETRYNFTHRLSITYHHHMASSLERHFGRGKVVDWSTQGLHVVSNIPVDRALKYRIRFHVEKFKGLSSTPDYWSREGQVEWVRNEDGDWHVGIRLDTPLDELPMDRLESYITSEDSCYLFLMLDESLLTSSTKTANA